MRPEDLPPGLGASWVSQCTVSLLPMDHERVTQYAVTVTKVNSERWTVSTYYGDVIWCDDDPAHVSYRELDNPDWVRRYTNSFIQALGLAWRVALVYTVNGRTAVQVLEQEGAQTDDHVPADPGDVVQEPDGQPEGEVPAGEAYAGRHRRDVDPDGTPGGYASFAQRRGNQRSYRGLVAG